MRKFWWTALALSLSASPLFAQDAPLAILETKAPMSKGTQPALMVTIPGATAKDVEKGLKALFADQRAKVKLEKGEFFGDNAAIKQLSENTVDLYARLTDTKEGVAVTLFVDLGGAFLSAGTHPDPYKAAENLLYQFAVEQTRDAIGRQVLDADKLASVLLKDKEKLEDKERSLIREIDRHEEHIKNLQREIEDARKLIEENKRALGAKQLELDQQRAKVEELKLKQKQVR